jgi:hypothetical protein
MFVFIIIGHTQGRDGDKQNAKSSAGKLIIGTRMHDLREKSTSAGLSYKLVIRMRTALFWVIT